MKLLFQICLIITNIVYAENIKRPFEVWSAKEWLNNNLNYNNLSVAIGFEMGKQLHSKSFTKAISLYEQKLKENGSNDKKRAESLRTVLRELKMIRSIAICDSLMVDSATKAFRIFSVPFATEIENALQNYGILFPGRDWEIGPNFPRSLTYQEWTIAKEHRINSGFWAGAYEFQNKVVLPGLKAIYSKNTENTEKDNTNR